MDQSLPEPLRQRVRVVVDFGSANGTQPKRGYVLYWMHHAVRAHENPSLDVAICLARQNQMPLLVYHALSEDYPYASNRHHAFILQGARDVQREMSQRGITYVFHLQRNGHRGPHLRDLVRSASVLVTEEMPVQPIVGWLERLTRLTTTPIISVDSSCLVTPSFVPKCYTRAFEFREATKHLYDATVGRDYPEQIVDCLEFSTAGTFSQLPFEPVNLQDVSLANLISECRIDHSIGPVCDSPGGSRSGYARWNAFKENGLSAYAKQRNDASLPHGVSRLSAYLHYGMVSPFRIAREANEWGAEKFLDELLIWRELAFHFCFHRLGDVDSLDALPDWATGTLQAHRNDVRDVTYSWERLSRCKSSEPLWNDCQRSLVRHGELHNNLRMTWGKALLQWTQSPESLLQMILDLNHRYALDGRDPSSYGGILWCLGQFDRPFEPEQPILGTVRPRPIDEHAKRINHRRYQSVVERPIAAELPSITIVGAGLAGLIAARTLQDHGLDVRVLEKSRGVGGRLATREMESDFGFDHGAQYFTARDPRFAKYVQSWIQDDLVKPWMGRIVELASDGTVVSEKRSVVRYVGSPSMNQIARHLASDLRVERESEVCSLRPTVESKWELLDSKGTTLHSSDVVIVNCPAPQAHRLLARHSDLVQKIATVEMQPCWAVMLRTSDADDVLFDGAFVNDCELSWVARNSSKPGRTGGVTTWMLHASASWSIDHLESSPEDVAKALTAIFGKVTHRTISHVDVCRAHLWRYAIPTKPLEEECLWDRVANLGACGDWCGGPRVEGAFFSGSAMAGTLLSHLTIDRVAVKLPSAPRQTSLF